MVSPTGVDCHFSLLVCVLSGQHVKQWNTENMRHKRRNYSSSEDENELESARKKLRKAVKQFEAVQGRSKKKKQRRKQERLRRKRASSSSHSSETGTGSESDVSRSSYEMDSHHSERFNSDGSEDSNSREGTSPSQVKKLSSEVLKMIGQQGPSNEALGEAIHEDVARVWSTLLQNGMEAEVVKNLLMKYPPVENCRLVEAPKLNMEVKRAITQQHLERDERLAGVQNQLGAALGAVGKALTFCLEKEGEEWNKLIELLGDAGKLLASVHYAESQSRRVLASAGINKTFKSTLTEVSVDGWLFGENLGERMKTTKALDKTLEDLRIPKAKAKTTTRKPHHLNSKSLPRAYYYQNRGRQSQPRRKRMDAKGEGRTSHRIKRFLRGTFRLKPSMPKYCVTWDPSIVLDYISHLESNKNLSLEVLSRKVVTLMALVTAHRVQTLALVRIQNISVTKEGMEIKIPELIKTSGPSRIQPLLRLPKYEEQPQICVVEALLCYLKKNRNVASTFDK
ncbi:hypothetical protein NQ317_000609 [Molorchus minor]|uniref:Uncharacterized protein n=1 Tax=Molorchus minor TaxID=1323400 RepID=A0ABQ9JQF0_9CUCU|nr:hypothetical protein NQ317_000609 [Molorchus minor]